MITLAGLAHQVATIQAAIPVDPTSTAVTQIRDDLDQITRRLPAAYQRLIDSLPGIPSSAGGTGGSPGTPDPTGARIFALDPATTALEALASTLHRASTLATATTHNQGSAGQLLAATTYARRIVENWARTPAARWCTHCAAVSAYKAPVARGRYKDLCSKCGDWRAVNRQLPPRDILAYLQTGDPIPQRLLDRHHMTVPYRRRKRRR